MRLERGGDCYKLLACRLIDRKGAKYGVEGSVPITRS